MKKHILIWLLAMITTFSFAQGKDDGQELINQFFDHYKNKGHEIALRYAFSTNKWIEIQGDEMNSIIFQLSKEVNSMGEYNGYEEIRSKRIGSRFRIVSYLVYYLRDPIRFTFELYKTTGGWEISDFQFDTNFEAEIEDAMKLSIENN